MIPSEKNEHLIVFVKEDLKADLNFLFDWESLIIGL